MKFMIKLKYILTTFILLFSITINGHGIYCTSNRQYKIYGGRVTSAYNSTYNSVNINSNVMYSGSNIGYTTNIGYNNIVYSSPRQIYNNYYLGTYNPRSISASSASKLRRITVYNGNGDTAETPGGNDDPEGIYRYNEVTDKWYYSPDNGITWYEWRKAEGFWERFTGLISSIFGIGGTGNDWRPYRGTDENLENSSKWASDPEDPFITPVGEFPIGLLLILMFSYLFYKINNKRTKKL